MPINTHNLSPFFLLPRTAFFSDCDSHTIEIHPHKHKVYQGTHQTVHSVSHGGVEVGE